MTAAAQFPSLSLDGWKDSAHSSLVTVAELPTVRARSTNHSTITSCSSDDCDTLSYSSTSPKQRVDQQHLAALSLFDLPHPLKLEIWSYLDVNSLARVSQTSCENLRLLHSTEASETLWKPACQREWPWLSWDRVRNLGDYHNHGQNEDHEDCAKNLPLLLHLAVKKSHGIDHTLFPSQQSSSRQQTRRPLRRSVAQQDMLKLSENNVVQFTGRVGTGDRCVRADEPLPRPRPLTKSELDRINKYNNFIRRGISMLQRIVLRRNNVKTTNSKATFRPFVAPYFVDPSSVDLQPRIVSYYEVRILENSQDSDDSNSNVGCIAVGLGDSLFALNQYMPGWDLHSFGYHGDDGGSYHASGIAQSYGPKFGIGDVVGCGVDYEAQQIFFTLNGEFLGYAPFGRLADRFLKANLYPVIGMDTHCPISCNFGTDEPFVFDLQRFKQFHEPVVRKALRAI
jgi:hypothetical protein